MFSIAGAIFHNLGQLAAVALCTHRFLYFRPLSCTANIRVIAGTVTATLLSCNTGSEATWSVIVILI